MPYLSSSVKEPDIAALPRVGAMATMPTRLDSFRQMLPTVLDQVDRLYVFLDGHDSVPDFAMDPKIVPLWPSTEGNLHASGRFLALAREPGDCICIALDDDILYPPDYAATLVAALVRYKGRAVVDIHGGSFVPPFESFLRDRVFVHFRLGLERDVRVDALGAGTSAFVASKLPLEPRRWPTYEMDDLMLALAAEEHGLARVILARTANYLRPIAEKQPDSLHAKAKLDDSVQTGYMRELMTLQSQSPWGRPARR